MIEIRRKVKVEKGKNRKLDYKQEQELVFSYYNYGLTPTELSKQFNIPYPAITSIITKWETVPKEKKIPIFITERELYKIKELGINFEPMEKHTEIIQYKESKINNTTKYN